MNERLTEVALSKVWCNPLRDKQQAYRLTRVTDDRGSMAYTTIFRDTICLPDKTSHWHVYQAGSVNPNRVNLPTTQWEWAQLSAVCQERQMLIEVYTEEGIQIPKSDVHYFYSNGYGFFIAVKTHPEIYTLDIDNVFIRFYSGVTYQGNGVNNVTVINSVISNADAISELRTRVLNLVKDGGHYFTYVNGLYVDEISLKYIDISDTVEVFVDPTVFKVFDVDIKDAPSFNSIRDNIRKYLIHPPKDGSTEINYTDDIDVYLIKKVNGRAGGVYYHHSQPMTLRQVTHRDYAVSVNHVRALYEEHRANMFAKEKTYPEQNWSSIDELTLRFYVRKPGTTRGLVNCANRIKELYYLTDADIVNAMSGTLGTIPFWRAEELENSAYVRFMGLYPQQFEFDSFEEYGKYTPKKKALQDLVGNVFGYHEATRILADTPNPTEDINGSRYAYLSYEYWSDATVYEYDENGYLIDFYQSDAEEVYKCRNANCRLVETITGSPGENIHYSSDTTPFAGIPKGYNFRLVVCSLHRGVPSYDWVDVTSAVDRDKYATVETADNGTRTVTWTFDAKYTLGAIVVDTHYVQRKLTLSTDDGLLQFSLNDNEGSTREVSKIPLRYLDIWLNGRVLQPNLDYHIEWPRVVLTNAEYLKQGTDKQEIIYRAYGLPLADFSVEADTEVGFIVNNELSRDGKLEFYGNRVLHITVDGALVQKENVIFNQEPAAINRNVVRNGAPYSVKCPTRVLRDVFDDDDKARAEDDERNRLVSDFLATKFPVTYDHPTEFISHRYNIISCFAQKVLHDIKNGIDLPAWYTKTYSEQDIHNHFDSYSWLLTFDACQYALDDERVKVIPHWYNAVISLPYYKYTLFKRVIKTYLNREIDTARFLRIAEVDNLP